MREMSEMSEFKTMVTLDEGMLVFMNKRIYFNSELHRKFGYDFVHALFDEFIVVTGTDVVRYPITYYKDWFIENYIRWKQKPEPIIDTEYKPDLEF